jgi:predicted amidophosphoribosyltransferase
VKKITVAFFFFSILFSNFISAWKCPTCTFDNPKISNLCQVCGENIIENFKHKLEKLNTEHDHLLREFNRIMRLSDKPAPKEPKGSWTCPNCTLENVHSSIACATCGQLAGSTPKKAPSAPPPPAPEDSWQCPNCTMFSSLTTDHCETCLNPRPSPALHGDKKEEEEEKKVAAPPASYAPIIREFKKNLYTREAYSEEATVHPEMAKMVTVDYPPEKAPVIKSGNIELFQVAVNRQSENGTCGFEATKNAIAFQLSMLDPSNTDFLYNEELSTSLFGSPSAKWINYMWTGDANEHRGFGPLKKAIPELSDALGSGTIDNTSFQWLESLEIRRLLEKEYTVRDNLLFGLPRKISTVYPFAISRGHEVEEYPDHTTISDIKGQMNISENYFAIFIVMNKEDLRSHMGGHWYTVLMCKTGGKKYYVIADSAPGNPFQTISDVMGKDGFINLVREASSTEDAAKLDTELTRYKRNFLVKEKDIRAAGGIDVDSYERMNNEQKQAAIERYRKELHELLTDIERTVIRFKTRRFTQEELDRFRRPTLERINDEARTLDLRYKSSGGDDRFSHRIDSIDRDLRELKAK